eukprot:Awhi_evm1s7109
MIKMSNKKINQGQALLEIVGPNADLANDRETVEKYFGIEPHFYGLSLSVKDLDSTYDLLQDNAGTLKDAFQPNRRIFTLRGKNFGMNVPMTFLSCTSAQAGRL